MKLTSIFSLLLLILLGSCQTTQQQTATSSLTSYVDPFIGTGGHGHVFPGATTPFGMVQLSPVNGVSGWDWVSGYHTSSNELVGFAHMCLSGTGIGDLADIVVLPTTKQVVSDTSDQGKKKESHFVDNYKSSYSHANESAKPGYYQVELNGGEINAEFTASPHTGMHKYTFSETGEASVIIDLGLAINWDASVENYINQESETVISGYRKSKGWANEQWVYFTLECNQKIKSFRTGINGQLDANSDAKGKYVQGVLQFDVKAKEPLLIKVGLSSASTAGSALSISAEIPHWDFDKQRAAASALWEKELQKIKIETKEKELLTTFYTALYHSMIAPNIHSDVNREYKGQDGKVHVAKSHDQYTVFSLWDTFRANHPLFTITQEDKVADFIHSFMAIHNEGGLLPVWELVGNETNCMIGYHAIPVVLDAWQKGLIKDIDGKVLLDAMVKSAMQDKGGLAALRKYAYIPAELENESVSKALEYAYDDWCIAQMAKSIGDTDIYNTFIERAGFYKNHFDASTGFMRGKMANGQWKESFDPLFSSHRDDEYTEGNAWQYSWFSPHDINGLVQLHGGKDNFVQRLDSLFKIEEGLKGEHASPDISGLIGQYAHGNEPSHHVAYMYNYVGMPWKSAEKVNEILRTMYSNEVDGICGNEDCGQMSAWYVFSSMGFYPVNPADGNYIFGTPLFDMVEINLANNKTFKVEVENNSKTNIYIQSATLNDVNLDQSWFTHKDLINGGHLKLVMGSTPNKNWGSKTLPPSMTN
ncbi:GH92 family glycosyl hydrolase [Carboxylicivirga sp. N1Y90]|uniref:GH92 family glycosyl hydrolase n=1 Tax=Carboxylicivirga fragile TaxID=3417571 RepID=UPI003D3503BA|nr:GH92 family glycosyl hydrolase [Marinilabiliaceae bacterium N1Y90]